MHYLRRDENLIILVRLPNLLQRIVHEGPEITLSETFMLPVAVSL